MENNSNNSLQDGINQSQLQSFIIGRASKFANIYNTTNTNRIKANTANEFKSYKAGTPEKEETSSERYE